MFIARPQVPLVIKSTFNFRILTPNIYIILNICIFFKNYIFQTDAIKAINEEKLNTMKLMVEQERRYVDQIRQDLASSNSTKLQLELDSAVKRLAKLEQQLDDLKAGKVRFEIVFKTGLSVSVSGR